MRNKKHASKPVAAKEFFVERLFVSEYYRTQRKNGYECAMDELDSLYCSVRHHPGLKSVLFSLKMLCEGEKELNNICGLSRALKERKAPYRQFNLTDQEAIHWLSNYYNELRTMIFAEAIPHYNGIYAWLRHHPDPRLKRVALGVHKIICAFSHLNDFVKEMESL